MTAIQTVAAGKTKAAKAVQLHEDILALGFSGITMQPNLTQTISIVAGRSGEGKSGLVQSCKQAYIINLDVTSTTTKGPPRARIWPGIRKDGLPVEPNPEAPFDPERGLPMTLTWERVEQQKDKLIQLAANDYTGRPQLVVLDTVDLGIELVMRHMVEKAGVAKFDDLHKNKWPDLYQYFVQFGVDLRRAGYGVCYVLHLGDKTIFLSDNSKEYLRDVPLIYDNLFNQLRRVAELVAVVEAETSEKKIYVPKTINGKPVIKAGKRVMVPTSQTTKKTEYFLSFVSEKLRGISKKRASMPDRILLPSRNQWDALESAYQKALDDASADTGEVPAAEPETIIEEESAGLDNAPASGDTVASQSSQPVAAPAE